MDVPREELRIGLAAPDICNIDLQDEQVVPLFQFAGDLDRIGDKGENSIGKSFAVFRAEQQIGGGAGCRARDEHGRNTASDAERSACFVGLAFAWLHDSEVALGIDDLAAAGESAQLFRLWRMC